MIALNENNFLREVPSPCKYSRGILHEYLSGWLELTKEEIVRLGLYYIYYLHRFLNLYTSQTKTLSQFLLLTVNNVVIRCYLLSFIVTRCNSLCHSLSVVVTRCQRCHSLHQTLSHVAPLLVTGCINCLSFDKQSFKLGFHL